MALLCYLLKGPSLALVRKRILASGDLLQRSFISFITTSSSSSSASLLSNHPAAGAFLPLTLQQLVCRSVDSCQRLSARRDIWISKLVRGISTSKFESQAIEEEQNRNSKMTPPVKAFERLPKNIVPVHYDITIKPDLVKLVFEGHESITLKVCTC